MESQGELDKVNKANEPSRGQDNGNAHGDEPQKGNAPGQHNSDDRSNSKGGQNVDDEVIEGISVKAPTDNEKYRPIDEFDWFYFFRQWLSSSEERQKSQANNIQEAIKWFFSLTSSAAIIGFVIKEPVVTEASKWFLSSSIFFLLISYAVCVWSYSSLKRSVSEPNIGDNIRREFNRAGKSFQQSIAIAAALMVVGMGLFPLGILNLYAKNEKAMAKMNVIRGALKVEKSQSGAFLRYVSVSGFTNDTTLLSLRLDSGANMLSTSVIDKMDHPLAHKDFDFIWPVKAGQIFNKDTNYYLIGFFKTETDTLKTVACLLSVSK